VAREFEESFRETMTRDEELRAFADPPTEHGVMVTTSVGPGWRVTPNGLASEIVTYAALRVLMTGQRTDTLEPLLAETMNVVDEFRRLVRGEKGTAYAVTGFEGVRPPPDRSIVTPWGELRQAYEFERRIQPFGPQEATAVLVAPVPVTLTIGEPGDVPQPVDKALARAAEAGGHLSLVFVLATWPLGEGARVVGDAIWQTTVVPAYPGAAYTGRLPRPRFPILGRPRLPPPLTDVQITEIEKWAQIVDQYYDPSLDIAAGRTVSAIRERVREEDSIIDAVIAWENLFGHADATTEITFRVTTAISRLLEGDPASRHELSRSLKQIYAVRSRVVHGLPITSKHRLSERANLAIEIAVRSLRALFETRPDLVADQDRATRLLLED
jgi:hypothetical protein